MAKEYLDKLAAFMLDAAEDVPDSVSVECKHFFSGAAFYLDGKICLTLTPVGLAVKLPLETVEKLIQNKTGVPLKYFPKAPVKQKDVLFADGIDKRVKTKMKYVRESMEYVMTLPAEKRKPGK